MTTSENSSPPDSPPNKPVDLADREELRDLLSTDSPVLVDFYTNGCTLCQSIEPVLGVVARATGITVGLLNPRDDAQLVDEYQIRSVPTLILFEDGEEVGRLADGFQGADAIISFLAETLDDDQLGDLAGSD